MVWVAHEMRLVAVASWVVVMESSPCSSCDRKACLLAWCQRSGERVW